MFKDIHGNELKSGDSIRLTGGEMSGRIIHLKERDFTKNDLIRSSFFGGRTRLCIGSSVSEPTPDWVEENKAEKII